MDKAPTPYLLHIRDSIELIALYIKNYTFEKFKSDRKTQDAVIRQLEIIGEATTHLEAGFKTDHPEIPWKEIAGFRNVLAHQYWDIDMDIVWKASTKEILELKTALLPIINRLLLEK
ncbi:hypothetical protein A3D77_00960 [Candidatus Gottesmanbacteria bacterium RIFCSPHIGHO2_02_FULL_39_11]|uniref:DUF86 domain-containing protein n=1 Tax=Candidatus Gottesmanbacteria bacterium RIFCSPHIGHO2_02_FULL_39_11 TaxID=1798382 RepID=A0A1F5ZPM7_9BACT|nr:MAG: hypothetical protein A3D77_00960 [Candidatus Gottesmanbacteria bacterium RIFCSPHIGHO2_02_FULL_39_11]